MKIELILVACTAQYSLLFIYTTQLKHKHTHTYT